MIAPVSCLSREAAIRPAIPPSYKEVNVHAHVNLHTLWCHPMLCLAQIVTMRSDSNMLR